MQKKGCKKRQGGVWYILHTTLLYNVFILFFCHNYMKLRIKMEFMNFENENVFLPFLHEFSNWTYTPPAFFLHPFFCIYAFFCIFFWNVISCFFFACLFFCNLKKFLCFFFAFLSFFIWIFRFKMQKNAQGI